MTKSLTTKQLQQLVGDIGQIVEEGRHKAFVTVDNILVQTYWKVGKRIVEFEKKKKKKWNMVVRLLRRLQRSYESNMGRDLAELILST